MLVVEDDERLAALLARGLSKSGHYVEHVNCGLDAKRLAIDGYFDVIVLDLMLPDTDGISLCEALRKDGVQTPILMLTARDEIDDKVAGLTAGADDYLTKPFSFEELSARLTALSRRPTQFVDTSVLRVRDMELVPESLEAKIRGTTVQLTRKESAVLELLMRNAGHAVGRETILDRLWADDFEPATNVVEAVVARLRAKIDKNRPGPSLIRTVRGIGYKVEP